MRRLQLLLLLCVFLQGKYSVLGQSAADSSRAFQYMAQVQSLLEEDADFSDSISVCLQKARELYLKGPYWDAYQEESLLTAQKMFPAGYADLGIQLLDQVNRDLVANKGEQYPGQVDLIYHQARGNYFAKNYAASISLAARNLPFIDPAQGETQELQLADHYNLQGAALRSLGKPLDAIDLYEKTRAIRQKYLGKNHTAIASILNNIGLVYLDLGLLGDATKCLSQAREIRENLLGQDSPELISILINEGLLYQQKGEYNRAEVALERALALCEQNRSSQAFRLPDILNNLGLVMKDKGAYQEANSYYQQAIEKYMASSENTAEEVGNTFTNLANLSDLQGNDKAALEWHVQSLHSYEELLAPNHPRMISASNNLALAYAEVGELDRAVTLLENTLALIDEDKNLREWNFYLNNTLAEILQKRGENMRAKRYLKQALVIQDELTGGKDAQKAFTYNHLAQIAQSEDSLDLADLYLRQALAVNHQDYQPDAAFSIPPANGFYRFDYFLESLMLRGKVLSQSTDPGAMFRAQLVYVVADSVLSIVRNDLLSLEDKVTLSRYAFDLSQAAIENGIRLANVTGDNRYLETAFTYSEKTKNIVLAQSIAANQAGQFAGIPDSLVQREDQLKSDMHYLRLAITQETEESKKDLYQDKLFTAQQAYRQLTTELEQEYPIYYQLKYEQVIPQIRAMQFALPENTALISYFTGDSILYSFVFTKADFKINRSPLPADFANQVLGLQKGIALQLDDDYLRYGQQLYSLLIPADLPANIQSLVLVPDSPLGKIPFEALLTRRINTRAALNFSRLPYLINTYDIRYSLSATLFYQNRLNTNLLERSGEGLLAIAPVFAEPQEVAAYASTTRQPIEALGDEGTRSLVVNGTYIAPLPATAGEVRAIADLFSQRSLSTNTLLYKDAREGKVKEGVLDKARYVHIATHGMVNEMFPDLSGLLFYPDPAEEEDHVLYSGEVYSLNLQAELVVLSACETGLGQVARGEGLLGLSRAFFYAGAQNLVVSLWKVQDQATSDLMVEFYQTHLQSQAPGFSAPLRQGKLKLIRSGDFSHPYYWSAFILIGQN